ncbi:MAG: cation:proton antiporter, partial [Candidatus Eremiobacteraeota bacterium]|nr:cation:proton antiporter [Candidatus Eremiobacteraeota bacterium]
RAIAAVFAAGLLVGILTHGALSDLFSRTTLYIFVPALIFEAAWHLKIPELRRHWLAVTLLAGPGVPLTAAIVAFFAVAIAHVTIGDALLLGSILAATDPIAVVAVFRRLHVPRELVAIVESESLFNDAVAVVLYRATLAWLAIGAAAQPTAHVILVSLFGSLGSLAIGALLGRMVGGIATRITITGCALLVSVVGAFGVYALCDALRWSGIFAVIAFAAMMRSTEGLGDHRRIELDRAWHRIALFANAALFFLMGAALDFSRFALVPVLVAATLLGVFVARVLLAYGLLAAVRLPSTWRNVVRVAGMRGALSLALALAIPSEIAGRGAIEMATFAVVVVTVLTGTLTLEPRLRKAEF